ncbi:MAG: hypothetical protein ABI647_09650 [Gemmatimonadota bacterium]
MAETDVGHEPPPPPPKSRTWRTRLRGWKPIVAAIVIIPIFLFAIYTFTTLTWSYSEGDRAGVLQKFSSRGFLCKTWEGELAMSTIPGGAPTIWSFTVRDADVAKQVNEGIGKRVVLHYGEHLGVPTKCFGDTKYFVNGVRVSE